jgi:hypothetical protein
VAAAPAGEVEQSGAVVNFTLSNTGQAAGSGGPAVAQAAKGREGSRASLAATADPAAESVDRPAGQAAVPAASQTAASAVSHLNYDVYRLSVSVEGKGWTARLLNALAAVKFGASQPVAVYVSHEDGSDRSATVTLRAASESDPSKTATASVKVK